MAARAKELGVKIQFEDAQGDIGKQLSQIQTFVAQKVDAVVVNPVDSAATPKMAKLIRDAGIPLVYVNRQPFEPLKPGSPSSTSVPTRTFPVSSKARRLPAC